MGALRSKVIEEAVHGLFTAGVEDGIIFEDWLRSHRNPVITLGGSLEAAI